MVGLIVASPLLAQERSPVGTQQWIVIASGFAMAIASAAGAIAQSKACSAACEGIARNPGGAQAIRLALILSLVLIESLALYTLLIVILPLLGLAPGVR